MDEEAKLKRIIITAQLMEAQLPNKLGNYIFKHPQLSLYNPAKPIGEGQRKGDVLPQSPFTSQGQTKGKDHPTTLYLSKDVSCDP